MEHKSEKEKLRLENYKAALETLEILRKGYYRYNGKRVDIHLATGIYDFDQVEVYNQQRLMELMNDSDGYMCKKFYEPDSHQIYIEAKDAYKAASNYYRPFVLNFANPIIPGGEFLDGESSQEEDLCRASSLYASINSEKAKEMYLFNQRHQTAEDSDIMLLSPQVAVFKTVDNQLIERPFPVSVLSAAAVDRRKKKVKNMSDYEIGMIMKNRIRMMLAIAARNMYRNLILGAWGCDEFENEAQEVAKYFYEVLIKEHYIDYFETVVFAIPEYKGDSKYSAFSRVFGSEAVNKLHQSALKVTANQVDYNDMSSFFFHKSDEKKTQPFCNEELRPKNLLPYVPEENESKLRPVSNDYNSSPYLSQNEKKTKPFPNAGGKKQAAKPFIEFKKRDSQAVEVKKCDTAPVYLNKKIDFLMNLSVNEEKKFAQLTYPMPHCNQRTYKDELKNSDGMAQGVFYDGIPFAAELMNSNENATVTIVIPYVPQLIKPQERKTEVRDEIELYFIKKNPEWNTILCKGMSECPEEMSREAIRAHIEYFISMGLLELQSTYLSGYTHILRDLDNKKIVAIDITIINESRVEAVVPLGFLPF